MKKKMFLTGGLLVISAVCLGFYWLRPAQLPQLGELPPFALVDQTGKPFGREELAGKVWVADFIFTSCAGVCPLLTHKMSEIQDFLSEHHEDGVKLVSFSVDPETDTPERLTKYAESFQADPLRWHFLTGPREAVEAVVMQGFKISMGQVPKEGETGFDVVHGERFVLVDRFGRIRSYYQSNDESLKSLRRDLLRLARQK